MFEKWFDNIVLSLSDSRHARGGHRGGLLPVGAGPQRRGAGRQAGVAHHRGQPPRLHGDRHGARARMHQGHGALQAHAHRRHQHELRRARALV